MTDTKFCQGLSDVSDSYSGYILDQWGVLHDGEKVYDGVLDCLKEMKSRGKQVIILSNSGKRAEENKARLKALGIGPTLYTHIVTAGEMTWQALNKQDMPPFDNLGKKCFLYANGNDTSLVDGIEDLEVVDNIDDADFLLIGGVDPKRSKLEGYTEELREGVRKGLKAICANPDMVGVQGSENVLGAGAVGKKYEEFGGVCYYIGKPHKHIFQYCLSLFDDVLPARTLVVGDSMSHDILGGTHIGLDTCLVRNGIHRGSFMGVDSPAMLDRILSGIVMNFGVRPTYMLDRLQWGKPLPDRKHKKKPAR